MYTVSTHFQVILPRIMSNSLTSLEITWKLKLTKYILCS